MENIITIVVSLLPVLGVVFLLWLFVFWIRMIIQCSSDQSIKSDERVLWILLLIFINLPGAIIYYLVRRPRKKVRNSDEECLEDQPTNTLAATSLGVGIGGIVLLSIGMGFIASIVAIVCGYKALAQIKQSGERGRDMAVAGIVLGYIPFVALLVFALVLVWGYNVEHGL